MADGLRPQTRRYGGGRGGTSGAGACVGPGGCGVRRPRSAGVVGCGARKRTLGFCLF
ncbi:hypothetical protein V6Z12_A13G031400 [Gossypium hirsutum]|uniref:Uncharacterized protein n=2 Tax=Gossypium TaxID=3633 RepID=A0A5D2MFN2_GOSTO|nr:hypothetical protein ES288_A13G028000v1 [Gossypium darwinii]TYH90165.1 hypothetical protein ES332_A13G031200v1 [Gossypium tomentosum]